MTYSNGNEVNQSSLPKVTFALLSYNQEPYVREAVEAALSQDYHNLEIVISDDCSMDKTYGIICDVVARSSAHHKVILNKNEKNLGIGGNLNRIMELSSGDFIVVAAGDDVSSPDRVEALVACWENLERPPCLIFSDVEKINSSGEVVGRLCPSYPNNIEAAIRSHAHALGCSAAWDRRLFDIYGGLEANLVNEDIVIPMRALLAGGGVHKLGKSLVQYRLCESHWKKSDSDVGVSARRASDIRKIRLRISALKHVIRDIDRHPEGDVLRIKMVNAVIQGLLGQVSLLEKQYRAFTRSLCLTRSKFQLWCFLRSIRRHFVYVLHEIRRK